jgi:hypothetical protein
VKEPLQIVVIPPTSTIPGAVAGRAHLTAGGEPVRYGRPPTARAVAVPAHVSRWMTHVVTAPARRWFAVAGLVLATLVVMLVHESGRGQAGRYIGAGDAAPRAIGRRAVVALVEGRIGRRDERLVRLSLRAGAVEGPAQGTPCSPCGASSRGRAAIAVVDAASLTIRCRFGLPRGVSYGGIVLARPGRLYAYGLRPGGAAVVTTLDAASGRSSTAGRCAGRRTAARGATGSCTGAHCRATSAGSC